MDGNMPKDPSLEPALEAENPPAETTRKKTKYGYLVENSILSEEELNSAMSQARAERKEIEHIFLNEMELDREDIGKSLELYYNVSYTGFNSAEVPSKDMFSGLNKSYLKKNNWTPLKSEKSQVIILVDDPSNTNKVESIQSIFAKKKIELRVGLKVDIHDFLNGFSSDKRAQAGGEGTELSGMTSLLTELQEESAIATIVADEHDEATKVSETDSAIVRLVNRILVDAYLQGVSDIHIEPGIGKKNTNVRFRKDGSCKVVQELPYRYKYAILSRLKIMSKLNIAEKRLPQDGKIIVKYKQEKIEYRVATCPTVSGNEDAVIRILTASKPMALEKMNFSKRDLKLIHEHAQKPYGLILAVGPTGSGKTTTLHSCMSLINTPEKKIWTAEDPVEITQEGLRQVQMHSKIGLDFAKTIRAFLRSDPDIIMVGEMRDVETCSIALEAALTGHLVLSTLHTNSAPETIIRLIDMGMDPLHFADALLLIVAQRLVQTLCVKCKEDYHPTQEEFDYLVKEYGEEKFPDLGIEYTDSLTLKRPVGCSKCEKTGYAGRTGLFELLVGTAPMKRQIMKNALMDELRAQAVSDGMTTLKQDGISKVFKGDCDLKQVNAVCIL